MSYNFIFNNYTFEKKKGPRFVIRINICYDKTIIADSIT